MRYRLRTALLLTAVAGLWLPVQAKAQTNDGFWSLWRSAEERHGARSQSLGGAATWRDDVAVTPSNPALLATMSGRGLRLSGAFQTYERDGFGQVIVAGPIAGLSLGGYLRRPAALRAGSGRNRLDYEVTEGGLVLAREFGALSVGAAIHGSHVTLQGEWLSQDPDGLLNSGTGGGSTKYGATVGLAYSFQDSVIAVAYQTQADWDAERTSQLNGVTADARSTYPLRRPSRIIAGFGYRPALNVLVVGQVEMRGPGNLVLRRGTDGTYFSELSGLQAARGGIEYVLPVGSMAVALRGGVAYIGKGGVTYEGPSTNEATVFAGHKGQTRPTGGVGLIFNGGSVDLAASSDSTVAVEVRLRF